MSLCLSSVCVGCSLASHSRISSVYPFLPFGHVAARCSRESAVRRPSALSRSLSAVLRFLSFRPFVLSSLSAVSAVSFINIKLATLYLATGNESGSLLVLHSPKTHPLFQKQAPMHHAPAASLTAIARGSTASTGGSCMGTTAPINRTSVARPPPLCAQ